MTPQVGIPLSVSPLLMYVRRDILAAHLPPSGALTTWSHLITLAATLNGTTDSDGDGRTDYALCLPLHLPCSAASLLAAVFASLAQTRGKQVLSCGLCCNDSTSHHHIALQYQH
jgi:hypothetical protein